MKGCPRPEAGASRTRSVVGLLPGVIHRNLDPRLPRALVVRQPLKITDEDGLYGIGECVAIPDTTRAMVDQITINFWNLGITDPLETKALYDKVYHRSFYHGRRGGVRVIGAITEPTLIRQLVEHIDARAAPPPSGH